MQALLVDAKWAEQMLEVVNESYFDLKYLQYLAGQYFAYARKYRVFPTLQLLVTIIRDDLKAGPDAMLRNQVVEYLVRMRANPDPGDLQYVKEKSLDFCKKQALKEGLEQAVDLMSSERYESIVDIIKKAVSVGTAPSIGHDFFNEPDSRFIRLNRNCIPTGLPELDRKGLMNGGLGSGELAVITAPTGAGKCTNSNTYVCTRYTGIKINGKLYKPWQRIVTQRGVVYARDVTESDEFA
jgi:DNA-dependent RNA polymerase auxiliary subunit epsilon